MTFVAPGLDMRLPISLLLLSALLQPGAILAAEASPAMKRIDAQVAAQPDWLADARACPVSLLPERQSYIEVSSGDCKTGLAQCLAECKFGDARSCYWLAYGVQQGGGQEQTSEALFQRACRLGVVSGCTNRAAGMLTATPGAPAIQHCAARTFEKGCALDDPWACTMYALHLSRGMGVKADPALALRVLEKSCKYGADDPACRNAAALRKQIELARTKGAAVK